MIRTPSPSRARIPSPSGIRARVDHALAAARDWADLSRRLAPLGLLVEVEDAVPLDAVRRRAPRGAPLH